ncbi:hypothetical protein Rsub_00514 [Raphidocelis subcapitata]|uniref:Ribosomal subunit interface protein n=1 Tax=Raphidocelis subcapitata TaxID=307507 RepID=A0A2V0NQI7_9CHLO|nr:hypothetical protein Rsub_00514 [Raphidocelis subcapitata]|eukprot:GBF87803.1 hypothetical protein Rsub_00514 [Raphidocelis subcapitata]
MLAPSLRRSLPARAPAAGAPPPPRAAVRAASVHRIGGRGDGEQPQISIHGRHVDVTPEIEGEVLSRLAPVLDKFRGAGIIESDGGVAAVDVRLMNSQAEVRLVPRVHSKGANETYVTQGLLKACESGNGWSESLDRTLDALDKKLTKWTKPAPKKVDYRRL